jgi:GNAT superfamily N-acetyltransferase
VIGHHARVLTVRRVVPTDLAGIQAISRATDQPAEESGGDARYVELLRSSGSVVVAVGEDVLGWAATVPTPFGELLSDLFVDPAVHGRRVGTALLRALWPDAPAQPGRFTFSSKHPAALPLYARAGLIPSWPLLYLSGPVARLPIGALSVERVDAATAAGASARLVGAQQPRTGVFAYWTRHPAVTGLLIRAGTTVVAAGAGGPDATGLGVLSHLTCPEVDVAAGALFAACLALGTDWVSCCLPGPHPALRPLLAAGFRIDDFDVTMRTSDVVLPIGWIYSPGLG